VYCIIEAYHFNKQLHTTVAFNDMYKVEEI